MYMYTLRPSPVDTIMNVRGIIDDHHYYYRYRHTFISRRFNGDPEEG